MVNPEAIEVRVAERRRDMRTIVPMSVESFYKNVLDEMSVLEGCVEDCV